MDEPTLTSLASSLTSLGCGSMVEQHPAGEVSSNTSNIASNTSNNTCNILPSLSSNSGDISAPVSQEEVASNSVSQPGSRRSSEELAADIIALPGWKLTFSELAGPAGGLSLGASAVAAQQSGAGTAWPLTPAAPLHTATASAFLSAAVAAGSPLSLGSADYEATAWSILGGGATLALPYGSSGEAAAWSNLGPNLGPTLAGGATLPHGSPWGPLLSPLTEGAAAQWKEAAEAGSPYELTPFASGEEGGGVASSAWLPRALMDEM